MGYLFLILTIVTESAAVICMKLSNGFENRLFTVIAIAGYSASFIFLTLALKTINAGIANAVWAGASTLVVAILGVIFFRDKLTTIQVLSFFLIVIGIIGLNVAGLQTFFSEK